MKHCNTLLVFAIICQDWSLTAAGENLKLVVTDSKLPSPRTHVEAFHDGSDFIYATGGRDTFISDETNHLLKYSLTTGLLEIIPSNVVLWQGSAVSTGEEVLYFGGVDQDEGFFADAVLSVSTATGIVTQVGTLPRRTIATAAAWDRNNGVSYVFGGYGHDIGGLNSVLLYNGTTHEIQEVAQLPEAKTYAVAVWDDARGLGYVFGGAEDALQFEILKYDPVPQTVTKLANKFPTPAFASCAVEAEGEIYIVGNSELLKFNPVTEGVEALVVDNWPSYLEHTGCTFVPSLNRVYLMGGWGNWPGEVGYRYQDKIMYIQLGTDPPTTTTTTERPPPLDCSDGGLRVIPNPFCCESFYVCNAGVPVKLDCEGGQQFNPESLQCDDESVVGCRSSYSKMMGNSLS